MKEKVLDKVVSIEGWSLIIMALIIIIIISVHLTLVSPKCTRANEHTQKNDLHYSDAQNTSASKTPAVTL